MKIAQFSLILLGLASTVAVAASIHPSSQKKAGPVVQIVNHLSQQGVSASRMYLHVGLRRRLLYVLGNDRSNLTVIDVTDPAKAHAVSEPARMPAETLTLAQDAGSSAGSQFVDLSNPENPKALPELAGATSVATDRERGMLYVSNAQGLWIVHDRRLEDPSVEAWEQFASAP